MKRRVQLSHLKTVQSVSIIKKKGHSTLDEWMEKGTNRFLKELDRRQDINSLCLGVGCVSEPSKVCDLI